MLAVSEASTMVLAPPASAPMVWVTEPLLAPVPVAALLSKMALPVPRSRVTLPKFLSVSAALSFLVFNIPVDAPREMVPLNPAN